MEIVILSMIAGMLGGYLIGHFGKNSGYNAIPFWIAAIISIGWVLFNQQYGKPY